MKRPIIFLLMLLAMTFATFGAPATVSGAANVKGNVEKELSVTAKSALLLDYHSGTVIYSKNENQRLPIASMTKIATLSVVFDALDKGIIKENDLVCVSQNAAGVGGSSAFLDAGSKYKVSELIKSVIIASANDSAVALAEYVAGSERACVNRMNKLAESLNLQDTHFENCTGLPCKEHYSSAHDLAKIYATICNHKIYKKYAKIWMDDFIHPSGRKTGLVNTNRLIKTYDGIEGGKTGYTDSAKFCLTASAQRNSMRLVGVIIGAGDSKTRFEEMTQMFDYGFANYTSKLIVNKDVPVAVLSPKNSKQTANVFPERDCTKFLNKSEDAVFSTEFQIDEVKAPIKKGDVVGKLMVFDKNNMVVDEVNLVSGGDILPESFKEILIKLFSKW